MVMVGTTIEFKTRVETGKDALNDPVFNIVALSVPDCLIEPISDPTSAREGQAIDQTRESVRVHFPKVFGGDLGGSYFAWCGKIFQLDSSSVTYMLENTPTRWNRHARAESVGRYDAANPGDIWLRFFVTEDSQYILVDEDETP